MTSKDISRRCYCIIAFYWVCQVVLNMSNGSAPDLISLAPAAAVAIVTGRTHPIGLLLGPFMDESSSPQTRRNFRKAADYRCSIITMVLVPEVVGSIRAGKIAYLGWTDTEATITVSANKGIILKHSKIHMLVC